MRGRVVRVVLRLRRGREVFGESNQRWSGFIGEEDLRGSFHGKGVPSFFACLYSHRRQQWRGFESMASMTSSGLPGVVRSELIWLIRGCL